VPRHFSGICALFACYHVFDIHFAPSLTNVAVFLNTHVLSVENKKIYATVQRRINSISYEDAGTYCTDCTQIVSFFSALSRWKWCTFFVSLKPVSATLCLRKKYCLLIAKGHCYTKSKKSDSTVLQFQRNRLLSIPTSRFHKISLDALNVDVILPTIPKH